jgi:hypothetical protein
MGQLAEFTPATEPRDAPSPERGSPAIRTTDVYVVFTSIDETLAAVRIAGDLAKALGVPLTLIFFRAVPYALHVDEPSGVSPVETDEFLNQVRSMGLDVRVRVYLCRDEKSAIPSAFRRHSLIVIGGRRRWWPARSERVCRELEAAGHFVVFVDERNRKEKPNA